MKSNWFPSFEELAADPSYTEAPSVGVQVQDFGLLPDDVTNDLVTKGYVAKPVYSGEDSTQLNTITNGIYVPGEDRDANEGQMVSLVTKWPTEMTIPAGGHVLAQGLDDDSLKLIEDEGYQLHTSVESFITAIERHQ